MLVCECFDVPAYRKEKMKPKDIEQLLSQLENGEISEDEESEDEDVLDYYESRRQLEEDLVDVEECIADGRNNNPEEDENASDPPLIHDDNAAEDSETNRPVLLVNYTGTLRGIVWKVKGMELVEEAFNFKGNIEYPPEILDLETPYQFFSYFFDDELLTMLVEESNRYAIQKNPNFTDSVSVVELRKFIGILVFSSVYHYPSVRSYWSNIVRFGPIADVMTLNRFEKIRQIFHMNDDSKHLPADHPKHDRLHKVRPVIDFLLKKFMSVPFEHRLSIDEQMCATKIGHFMKQYLPNKPHKWGLKLYVICCLMGYAYNFEVYSGTNIEKPLNNEPDLKSVSNTVIRLLRPVPRHVNHIIYFDNFYTNIPLLHYLFKEGIYCLGTVQRNRLGKSCKLPDKKNIMKPEVARGTYHENVATYEGVDFAAVSWKDNKPVTLLSTYVGSEPVESTQRYDKKQKKSVQITCPRIIKEYNAHMGGVDLMDSFLGRYRIRMKSRKWTTRLFYHLLDMTVINSWVLYKKVSIKKGVTAKDIISLADYRTLLADTLCRYQSRPENKRGRPSTSNRQSQTPELPPKIARAGVQVVPSIDIRKDGIGHEKMFVESRNKCKYLNCRKLTSWMCKKCKVSLCDNKNNMCFQNFHS